MTEELKGCPWCNSNSAEIVSLHIGIYYVRCANDECHYEPTSLKGKITKESAITAWNTRHEN